MYISTRGHAEKITASQAIVAGIAPDGGLYVPESFPKYSELDISNLCDLDYKGRAKYILSELLDDFTDDEIASCVNNAYGNGKFPEAVAPIAPVSENLWSLELWHGPTCAFKDMALQILPHLMTTAMKKNGTDKKVLILVATSGDTGKAALEVFKDVEGTKIITFFPEEGVSKVQKLQMTTQEGKNVNVFGVYGNFDDVQTAVKKIFVDKKIIDEIAEKGYTFSSANSINWGRLVPQIVYYFSAYCDLVNSGFIGIGDEIEFCVPTGNFGNILAGYYARKMGLPVKRFICASNANNVLTDFITTGKYSKCRDFYTTISPSMDILISSNLERLLFDLSDNNAEETAALMEELNKRGSYSISEGLKEKLQSLFAAGSLNDEKTMQEIKARYTDDNYLCDTHTAVALGVYRQVGDKDTTTVIVSTADPYKFNYPVLKAIGAPINDSMNEFMLVDELARFTKTKIPAQISSLKTKEVRFNEKIAKYGIANKVRESI